MLALSISSSKVTAQTSEPKIHVASVRDAGILREEGGECTRRNYGVELGEARTIVREASDARTGVATPKHFYGVRFC